LAACALLSQPHAVEAQTQSTEEEDLALLYGDKSTVSIATGTRQPLRRAPAVATVITAQDIAAMGATDLDDVLESVPGMHVSRSNNAYAPLYLIRGIQSEFNPQTLMLQNGVPVTTLFVGNRGLGWGGLPVENIARIEIIRGPGSALYGADAYSGVINIITKTAADIAGTEVGVRAGSFKSRNGWVQYGGKVGTADIAAYLGAGSTDGFKETVAADQQSLLDGMFVTHASLAPGPVNVGYDSVDGGLDISQGKLRFRAGYKLRDNLGTGAGVAAALDPVGKFRTERFLGDLSWNDIEVANNWRMNLQASYLHYKQTFDTPLQLFPPGAFGGSFPNGMIGAPDTWERQWRLSATATYSGIVGHNLRLGAGYDDLNLYKTREFKNFSIVASGPLTGLPVPTPSGNVEEFPVSESFMEPQQRKVRYLYVQDEWNIAKDWTLTAGLRRDQYSDFGGTTNPRLALVWDANLDLTAKLLYGRAFRAPAFTEQYSINNPVIRGNPRLEPETIHTLEAAFSWQARPDTQLNLSLFRYDMKDIIRTTDTGSGTRQFNNVGSQHGSGMELEVIWDASRKLRVTGNYAYQRSVEDATGADAGYAPHHHLHARADWSVTSGWLASAQINRVADRQRAAGDARPPIADYTTVDLTLRTSRGKDRWDFAASIRNAFNADAREPSLAPGLIPFDLPLARRSIYLQAGYRL
jgi:iron complex outermembrane receptor protein